MKKGYSVIKVNENIVKSIDDVKIKEELNIEVNDGIIKAVVTEKKKGR